MTTRDYFAGQALAGIMADPDYWERGYDGRARNAFAAADAMMAERGKRQAERMKQGFDGPWPSMAEIDALDWEDEVNEHATETEENYG